MKKKYLVVVGTALLIAMSTLPVYANNLATDSNASSQEVLWETGQINGVVSASVENLFSKKLKANNGTEVLENVVLEENENGIVLSGSLSYNGENIDFASSGTLYKNERTENARTFGDLILGDMADFNGIHFVQFRIDKELSKMSIILQDEDTGELLLFEEGISDELFDEIYNSQANPTMNEELEEKIIDLYSVSGNLINEVPTTDEVEATSPIMSTNDSSLFAASYNGWTSLISDLNMYGSVNLNDYSNIDTTLFKGNGWKYDNQWGRTPYTFASYSKVNAPGEFLTQFTLVDIITQSNQGVGDLWEASMQASYFDGMIVEYTEYNDTLSVLYYGWGISYDNFKVGINGLTNQAVFIDRSVNRSYQTSGSIVRAAISVYSPFATVADVFANLLPYESQSVNTVNYFDETYSAQYNRYGGKVIRGIVASTENNRMTSSNHYVNVAGTIRYNINLSTNWIFGYNYNVYHNL